MSKLVLRKPSLVISSPICNGIDSQTLVRKNMTDSDPKWFVRQLMKIRRRIETVIMTVRQKKKASNTIHINWCTI